MALAAPLLLALALLATYIGYLILQRTLDAWLRPVLQWLFAPRQSFWKRALLWPVREVGKGLKAVLSYVAAILGGAFYLAGAALARFLHAVGWTEDLLTLGMQRAFQAMVDGMIYLREVAVPKLIAAQVKPVADKANTAFALATAATTTLTGISTEFANGLRSLPWGAPIGIVPRITAFWNAFEHIWDQVFKHIVPRLDLIQYTTLPRVAGDVQDIFDDLYRSGANSLPRIRQRLGQLEGKIGDIGSTAWWEAGVLAVIAAIAGVTVAAARLGIQSLFCRNTQGLTRQVCAAPNTYIDEVLALVFAVEAIENLPTLVRIMQGVARETAEGLQQLAEV